ncbi:beta-lactamase-like protein [Bombardia bombarda]|uniref:Beta-lactamase-like protein n=1 Tax=Bombardia bombarda TaxID=252184 RepID=A0AA40C911_9PEZI|nr:beta-lactamase-like protein [Bombardia bombarda]
MSTFNGLVAEFPDIRVDYFRGHADLRPPLACFLSHVHSDHLAGLESLRSPFVYCSAATKEILLRLERFPCRINYAKGILEARLQRYKHLKNLLKPLPLETPTVLELEPGNRIRVTLFNANHCPGAVMFLFEGQGKAALYTGDIRSEPWFVNTLARSPSLIEYSSGLKTLGTIYLDTSFIDDIAFQTKAEGIHELLQKVSQYPADTIFHFQAWTYGYEDVWLALSRALDSQIHVDEYKMRIYSSLVVKVPDSRLGGQFYLSPEAAGLVGFMCGNTHHPGCLTVDESARLHSCEKGNYCSKIQNSSVVWIQPVIAHLPDGQNMAEVGVGGGGDDLECDVELDYFLPTEIDSLLEVICDTEAVSGDMKEQIRRFLLSSATSGRKLPLDLERSTFGDNNETTLTNAIHAITKTSQIGLNKVHPSKGGSKVDLPNIITFPYSRHSSYPELCHLLDIFKPRDVWPCTVSLPEWFNNGITVKGLFGQHCSGQIFRHDKLTEEYAKKEAACAVLDGTQTTSGSAETSIWHAQPQNNANSSSNEMFLAPNISIDHSDQQGSHTHVSRSVACSEGIEDIEHLEQTLGTHVPLQEVTSFEGPDSTCIEDSQDSILSEQSFETRMNAFQAMLDIAQNNIGAQICLLSTTDNHTELDQDLGER